MYVYDQVLWYLIYDERSRPHPCEFLAYIQSFLPCEPTPTIQEPVPTPTEPITYEPPVLTQPTPIVGFEPVEQSIDKVYYYHSDHLGSSTYVTDDNGRPVAYYDYLPFGEVAVEHNQTTNFNNGYKFNAKELDETTGMSYYGARYYDSRLSVFVSVDPLAEETGTPYQYCNNNPVNFVDPDGRYFIGIDNKKVIITYNKDGTLNFSKNASKDLIRSLNALNLTKTGREQLNNMNKSSVGVRILIDSKSKIEKLSNGNISYTYGEAKQGNSDKSDNFGKRKVGDKYSITEATITIFEGTIKEGIKEGSGLKHEGLTLEQAIGAVVGHEGVHATDKDEIHADIYSELKGKKRFDGEIKPNQIENKIIKESKELN